MIVEEANIISLTNDTRTKYKLNGIKRVMTQMIKDELFNKADCVSINLTTSDTIAYLNKKYRGTDEVTDVLTFTSEANCTDFRGDIVIDVITADKDKGNISLQMQLDILSIHGLLHIAGFDHITEAEKTRMSNYEQKYYNILNSNR